MSEQLDVPPELLHLIEKRERSGRRKKDRRAAAATQEADSSDANSSVEGLPEPDVEASEPREERRSGHDRRTEDRRQGDQ